MLHGSRGGQLKAKVLLVEDSRSDTLLIRMALERTSIHCDVTHCNDSEAALGMLMGSGSAALPDLIILDLNTPRKNGFELLGDLQKFPELASIPALVLTSSISPDDKARARRLGVRHYVSKPLELDQFLRAVASGVEEVLTNPGVI